MSGIESIMGLASGSAGLLSLGIQLGDSAMKLREMYHKIKDAPKRASKLIFSIETIALALKQLEEQRQRNPRTGVVLARCILDCQSCTLEIQALANKMAEHLAKHTRIGGKLYVAFKDSDINQMLDDLEKSKTSLELAYTLYCAEEQRRSHQEQAARLRGLHALVLHGNDQNSRRLEMLIDSLSHRLEYQTTEVMSDSIYRQVPAKKPATTADSWHDSKITVQHKVLQSAYRKRTKTRFRAILHLPYWLCQRVWHVALTQSQYGLNIHLQTYNVIPDNSPVFLYCRRGDLVKLHRLFETGRASPLDIAFDQWGYRCTLLETAASCGHRELCQYLLDQTTSPDLGTDLLTATRQAGWAALPSNTCRTDLLDTFLKHPDFEIDGGSFVDINWLSVYSVDGTTQIAPSYISDVREWWSIQERFDMAEPFLESTSPTEYLFYLGMDARDERLASLITRDGTTILHRIASRYKRISRDRGRPDLAQEWLQLGLQVIKNGADVLGHMDGMEIPLHHMPSRTDYRQLATPLQTVLGISHRKPLIFHPSLVECMQRWVGMIEQAGIDVQDYARRESRVWETQSWKPPLQRNYDLSFEIQQGSLETGPKPLDWTISVLFTTTLGTYELGVTPGSFAQERILPRKILWRPDHDEEVEGIWDYVGCQSLKSVPYDSREAPSLSDEPMVDLFHGVQDDSGPIMLMQYRASRVRRLVRRSYSQPPCDRRRVVARAISHWSSNHPWVCGYHLCPLTHQWMFNCAVRHGAHESRYLIILKDSGPRPSLDLRSCVQGAHDSTESVQQSEFWRKRSFMADMVHCQDGARDESLMRSGHSFTGDCPQGCMNVRIDRLNVPSELRQYHPRRRFVEEDD